MKKSKLLALGLASLVGLVGCGGGNAAPSKSANQKLCEDLYSYFYDGEYQVTKSDEKVAFGADGNWDWEKNDDSKYYFLEGSYDAWIFALEIIPLSPITDGLYYIEWRNDDGSRAFPDPVDIETLQRYTANVLLNTFLDEECPLGFSHAFEYNEVQKTDELDNPILSKSSMINGDGTIEGITAFVEFYHYIVPYQDKNGNELAMTVAEAWVYNVPEDISFTPKA